MNSDITLEVRDLCKSYGDVKVVDSVNLQIYKGECFGILGPNGAGKSTLMKMMYGTVAPSRGDLFVLGLNSNQSLIEIKSRIGVIPQEDGLDVEFTALENLLIYARFHGIDSKIARERAEELLRLVKLEESAEKFVQNLSGGMRRRLTIARGLLNRPEVVFLDEPTTGLDPQARFLIWSFLKKIKAELGTLVMTTHYMEEAQEICDRIAIVDQGRILALGKPKDLIAEHIGTEVVEFESNYRDLQYDINRIREKNLDYQVTGTTIRVHIKAPQLGREVISLILSKEVTIRHPSLNDVFLKLAGYNLRENW